MIIHDGCIFFFKKIKKIITQKWVLVKTFLSKIIFFKHIKFSSDVCKRYYSKKLKYTKKLIFDKRIFTKTYLWVMI